MKRLLEGIRRFQNEIYPRDRELFRELASRQSPRWLIITCADSRVVPNLIAQVGPGELFMCRNAGNIVPAHGDHSGGVAATIEYAVQVLKVRHIIVCGHSDCGAMKAVLNPETVKDLPAVSHWVEYAARARAIVLEKHKGATEEAMIRALTDENVLAQLDNLKTIPCVGAKLSTGALDLHGWVYDIQTGHMRIWIEADGRWHEVDEVDDDGLHTVSA